MVTRVIENFFLSLLKIIEGTPEKPKYFIKK
jgi:hypothetical protein